MVAVDKPTISAGRVQDWITSVINPILDGVRRELRFLPTGPWRWHPKNRAFEFFVPVKDYVPHPFTDNYQDLIEKHEELRGEFGVHDGLLAAFGAEFARGYDLLQSMPGIFENERGEYGINDDNRDWFVAYVVGGFERLPDYYVGHDVYNPRADRLLAAGRGALEAARVDVAGLARQLADSDDKLAIHLVDLRRELADRYGVRVRPS